MPHRATAEARPAGKANPTRSAPVFLWILPSLAALVLLLPLIYLGIRSSEASVPALLGMLLRPRNTELLRNTFLLGLVTLGLSSVVALPLAWITERTDFPRRRWVVVLAVLPLAIPGYVMAYALLSIGGHYGLAARLFGLTVPRPSGLWGSGLALSLYTFPYLYLNLRTALSSMDRSLEESAASFGYSRLSIFFRVILPQLKPAFLSGGVVIALYAIGDFGVVALMRYPVFSYAVYTQYAAAFDRVYAAVLSLALSAFAAGLVVSESRLVRKAVSRPLAGAKGRPRIYPLGWWKYPATLFVGLTALVAAGFPLGTLAYWTLQIGRADPLRSVATSFGLSFIAAVPAAAIATAVALPTVYLADRYPSRLSAGLEQTAALGYGIPPIALALGLVFFSLRGAPVLYQSYGLLVVAYSIHFLALALGPIRSSLVQAPHRIEEAARSLGYSRFQAVLFALFPALSRGITSSFIIVFVMAMKELPLTLLLSPTGYTTLAAAVFSRTNEGQYAEAAPFAAGIVLFSSLCAALVIWLEGTHHAPA